MTYLVGQRLGRYEIQEEIGRGGMARVYRAFDTALRRTVALKVLAPQLAVDPEFAHRFEREAVTAAGFRHPNIVGIYDVGEQDGVHYIAMEYVRGRSLFGVIEERGALGLGYAVAVVEAVASALDYAHAQGAVHRDVKPQNIMIDTDGRVLLTDFGIAQPPDTAERSQRLTRTGVFMGTPEYISPEQASAERVDGRSDLYSLGIVTYEMITGAVPFSGSTLQIIVAHVQNEPPTPSSIVPDLPPELDMVLARILAKQPQQRYASGAAFTSALRIAARKNLVPIATQDQMAQLAAPQTTAGHATARVQTPMPVPVPPRVVPSIRPPLSSDSTKIGASPLLDAPPPRRRTPPPVPVIGEPQRRSAPLPVPMPGRRGGAGSWVPNNIMLGLLGGVVLFLVLLLFRNPGDTTGLFKTPTVVFTAVPSLYPTVNSPTPTATPTPTAMPEPSAAPATAMPTSTPEPSATALPPATAAPVLPTWTPVLPTWTPLPPSETPLPPTSIVTSTATLAPYPPPASTTQAPTAAITSATTLLLTPPISATTSVTPETATVATIAPQTTASTAAPATAQAPTASTAAPIATDESTIPAATTTPEPASSATAATPSPATTSTAVP